MYIEMEACESNIKKLEKGYNPAKDIKIFKLLSNPIRLKIALLLSDGEELCTCDLERILECEQTLISHHMKPFKELDLVAERREGKWKHYTLKDERVKKILEIIK
jgi:DNA-binding transcriptional ArsR family regulator